jgi:hypothetical protein
MGHTTVRPCSLHDRLDFLPNMSQPMCKCMNLVPTFLGVPVYSCTPFKTRVSLMRMLICFGAPRVRQS